MLAGLMLIQAVAGPPSPRAATAPVETIAQPCPDDASVDEVVVCGRKRPPPRLVTLPEERLRSPQDMATFRLPGHATGNVHAIQSELPGGTGSGAAVTLRIPFGKGRKD